MKATAENAVKKKVKALLDYYGIFHWPASASPYGVAGVPDRLAIVKGRCVGVEVKAPGKKPTALQAEFGRRMQLAGGHWFLIDGDEGLELLKLFLEETL